MSREIKFRAWDFAIKEMSKPCDLYGIQRNFPPLIGEYEGGDFVFMQYAGLKDKNGVEIYEGDIVLILYTDWASNSNPDVSPEEYMDSISNIGQVVFRDCKFCIQFNKGGYAGSIHAGTHGQIKVVGNIYENPELIKQ